MKKPSEFVQARWKKWLDRRVPPTSTVRLDQRKIFIFPSKFGFLFLATVFLLFLGGINYQNSLILNLCFLLVSLFVVSILHTFRNLSGLIVRAGRSEPAFLGSKSSFELILERDNHRRYESINVIWHNNESGQVDVVEQTQTPIKLLLDPVRRGWFKPNRVKLESYFPLGLIRAWSWIDLDMASLVYPKPLKAEQLALDDENLSGDGERKKVKGSDDFDELRKYQIGESLNNIAWKHFAQGRGIYSKTFHGYQSESQWLTWRSVNATDTELKLSKLTYLVLKLSKTNQPFGLEIPGVKIEPSTGHAHEQRCLKALALYGAS